MCHRFLRSSIVAVAFAALIVLLLVGLAACGSDSSETTAGLSDTATSAAGEVQELTVSAASSLKGAFTEIAAAFDQANNAKTTLNFDAAGTLQKQIEGGAPVDVFASAAPKQVNNLLEAEPRRRGIDQGLREQRDRPGGAGRFDPWDHELRRPDHG